MVRKNENTGLKFSAKIILRGDDGEKKKQKAYFNKEERQRIEEAIKSNYYKEDGWFVWEYLMNGRLIELREGQIYLYPPIPYQETIEYLWSIQDNPELFALLEQLVEF